MRMNRTWYIMGVKFLGCDSHRVVVLVSFVFGGFHRDSTWGDETRYKISLITPYAEHSLHFRPGVLVLLCRDGP